MDPFNRPVRLASLVLLWIALAAAFAHALEKQPAATYHARRVALAEKLQGGAAILFAAEEPLLDFMPYRQDEDFYYLTGWNEPGVYWGESGRVQGELMVQDVAMSREIEVRMIREIDHGVLVGGGRIFNPEVALHQRVPNHSRQVARISGLAAFTEIAEFYSICDRLCFPDHVVEAPRSAMKRVCAIVQG